MVQSNHNSGYWVGRRGGITKGSDSFWLSHYIIHTISTSALHHPAALCCCCYCC